VPTFTNVGNRPLVFNSISLGGANPSNFSLINNCNAPLAPNASCSVSMTFTPSGLGTFTATLVLDDNAPGSPHTLLLNGVGVTPTPVADLSPGSISFDPIAQGATEGPKTITIYNHGTGPLHVTGVSLSGANPGDFSQTNNCTGTPLPVVIGTCTINVSFTPAATGMRAATLTVSDDASDSPQFEPIQGSATAPFQIAPALGSSTMATVAAGQPPPYSFHFTPPPGLTP